MTKVFHLKKPIDLNSLQFTWVSQWFQESMEEYLDFYHCYYDDLKHIIKRDLVNHPKMGSIITPNRISYETERLRPYAEQLMFNNYNQMVMLMVNTESLTITEVLQNGRECIFVATAH